MTPEAREEIIQTAHRILKRKEARKPEVPPYVTAREVWSSLSSPGTDCLDFEDVEVTLKEAGFLSRQQGTWWLDFTYPFDDGVKGVEDRLLLAIDIVANLHKEGVINYDEWYRAWDKLHAAAWPATQEVIRKQKKGE
jgi:hypothetical protein